MTRPARSRCLSATTTYALFVGVTTTALACGGDASTDAAPAGAGGATNGTAQGGSSAVEVVGGSAAMGVGAAGTSTSGGEAGGPSSGGASGASGGSKGTAGAGGASMSGSGIGEPCTSNGTHRGTCAVDQLCIADGQFGFVGGYCTSDCAAGQCPTDAACVQVSNNTSLCFAHCAIDNDCRPEYACDPGAKVCVPISHGGGGVSNSMGVPPGTKAGAACVNPPSMPPASGFEHDKLISKGQFGAETQLAVNATTKRVVVSWIDVDPNTGDSVIGAAISDDGGDTFPVLELLPKTKAVDASAAQSDPVVTTDPAGNFFISWVGYDPTGMEVANMTVYVAKAAPGGRFDTIVKASPPNEWVTGQFLDKPWIAASPVDGALYVTWDRMDSNGASDIRMARSADAGKTWSMPVVVSDGAERPSFGRNLAQVAVSATGNPFVAWVEVAAEQFGSTSNRVYAQRFDATGAKIGKNVRVSKAPDSPPFEDPSVALSGNNVYVGYSSGGPDGKWDIAVATSLDGGATFGAAVKANDDGTCATHFHQQLATDASGAVHAVWYDNRYLTGNVFHATSPGASASASLAFGPNAAINATPFPFTTNRDTGEWVGDYLGMTFANGVVHTCWSDPRSGTAQIYYARSRPQ